MSMVQVDSENMSYYGEKEADDASSLLALKNMQHYMPQTTNRPQIQFCCEKHTPPTSSTI
eukprot:scaffold12948_cov81-Skeletonema_dohrnii-CCMP3373.AAC.1